MPRQIEGKTFGVIPSGRMRIRIETMKEGRVVATDTYSVYGGDRETVNSVIVSALGAAFPSDEEEQVPPPSVRTSIRMKQKRGR